MTFTTPTPWQEAIASRDLKTVLPTSLSSGELKQLPADLRERAMFSAKTTNADYLQKINDLITRIVSPEVIKNPTTGNYEPTAPGQYMDAATARLEMKQALQAIGYQPPDSQGGRDGQRGGLQDLSSDVRLDLIIKTNTEMAQGFGNWFANQDPARLDAWPAQELYRLEERKVHRDWIGRWLDACRSLGLPEELPGGKMIALKDSKIWTEISAFDLPYPPYDFNSGMWVRDISRSEAIDLGVMEPDEAPPSPDLRGFNDDLQANITDLATPLQEALITSMKGVTSFVDGVLSLAK